MTAFGGEPERAKMAAKAPIFASFFLKKMTVFGGKLGKNAPNMAFFGALRANRGTFCSFTAKVPKIK